MKIIDIRSYNYKYSFPNIIKKSNCFVIFRMFKKLPLIIIEKLFIKKDFKN
jgi:hypothetical protein